MPFIYTIKKADHEEPLTFLRKCAGKNVD